MKKLFLMGVITLGMFSFTSKQQEETKEGFFRCILERCETITVNVPGGGSITYEECMCLREIADE